MTALTFRPARVRSSWPHRFQPHGWLDRVFAVGIIAKGLNGLAELVGGLLLLFVGPGQIHRLVAVLTQGELWEDPHDWVASHLLQSAGGLTAGTVTFGAIYLLAHGVVKVVLVVALLRDQRWAYPWMIGVLIAFVGYQLYRIALGPTAGLVALTVFDLVIVALTWREWRLRRVAPERDRERDREREPDHRREPAPASADRVVGPKSGVGG